MTQEELLLEFTADKARDLCYNAKELDELPMKKFSKILELIKFSSSLGYDTLRTYIDYNDVISEGVVQNLRRLKYDVEVIEYSSELNSHLCKISWKNKENNEQENNLQVKELTKRLVVLEKIVQQIYYAPDMPGAILAQIEFIKKNEDTA